MKAALALHFSGVPADVLLQPVFVFTLVRLPASEALVSDALSRDLWSHECSALTRERLLAEISGFAQRCYYCGVRLHYFTMRLELSALDHSIRC